MSEEVLKKWDSLFQELKTFVEVDLPKMEESVKKAVERSKILESKVAEVERKLKTFIEENETFKRSVEEKLFSLENIVNKRLEELEKKVGEERKAELDLSFVEELKKEIAELKNTVAQLSVDVSQIKSSVGEKFWVAREKKAERKSPRIL